MNAAANAFLTTVPPSCLEPKAEPDTYSRARACAKSFPRFDFEFRGRWDCIPSPEAWH